VKWKEDHETRKQENHILYKNRRGRKLTMKGQRKTMNSNGIKIGN
jgi:hypothetical protein